MEQEAINHTSMQVHEIIIVTGLSGAGMSTALQVFEDMNFFTADGLPPSLIEDFTSLCHKPDMQHFRGIALGIDLKRKYLIDPLIELLPFLNSLRQHGNNLSLLFLEANEDSIIKRYASTRRPHPLEQEGYTLKGAMKEEKHRLERIREHSDIIIDTSTFSLHDLRRYLQKQFSKIQDFQHSMWVNIMSFGYKYGIPKEADLVFDVRFLPNPYFDPQLRDFTGLNQEVVSYIFKEKYAQKFREQLNHFLQEILPYYDNEGRYRLCIAIGCTGGYHRSVAMVEYLSEELTKNGYRIIKEHKNIPQ